MTLSVIYNSQQVGTRLFYAVDSICVAARRLGLESRLHDLEHMDDLSELVRSLGDIVIFRGCRVVKGPKTRTEVLRAISSQRLLINKVLLHHPWLRMSHLGLALRPAVSEWQAR